MCISLLLPRVGRLVYRSRLLFCCCILADVPNLSAGFPPYIIQEEFDRYVGFLWKETNSDHCTLLYIVALLGGHCFFLFFT